MMILDEVKQRCWLRFPHRAQLAHIPNQNIRYREGSMAIERQQLKLVLAVIPLNASTLWKMGSCSRSSSGSSSGSGDKT